MKSLWRETVHHKFSGNSFSGTARTDVLIIGGGICGILTAYLLKQAGVDCVVAEGGNIGHGVTQNTTAKVTAQHGLIYADLLKKYGREKAAGYYRANATALAAIRDLAKRFPCDLEDKAAHIYTTGKRDKIEREAAAYEQLGIPGAVVDDLPIPVAHEAAIRMDNQAQFHPLKFLYGLAGEVDVFENTFVHTVKDGMAQVHWGEDGNKNSGTIQAGHIVLCTHYPLVNVPGLYFMKLNQERSYVAAVEDGPDISGMYLDQDAGGYSFRNYGSYLLIGGGDHITGRKGQGYRAPLGLAEKAFPGKNVPYAWATQDCMSLDRVPYAGRFRKGKDQLYLASGFNKWGMTGSMAAAMVLRDLLTTGRSEYEDLFLPYRSMWQRKLAANMWNAMGGMIGLKKRCPHLGCALRRNEEENSWDCPCHGSRFDAHDGRVLDNPATKGITIRK